MWRVFFIAAIFISSFFSSTGGQTTYSCGEGFNLEGSKCRQVKDSHFECRYYPGIENGATCMTRAKYCHSSQLMGPVGMQLQVRLECPVGFRRSFDNCEGTVDRGTAVEQDCPSPYQKRSGRCVTIEAPVQVCPPNRSNLRSGCFARSYKLYGNECNWGYRRSGNRCEFVPDQVGNKDEKTCGFTHTLDTTLNMCVSKQSFAPPFHCDQGYPQDNRCVETLIKPIEEVCPPESGHSVENPLQPRLSCLQGVWRNLFCVNTVNVDPIKICPRDFRFVSGNDGMCESTFTVDATPVQ